MAVRTCQRIGCKNSAEFHRTVCRPCRKKSERVPRGVKLGPVTRTRSKKSDDAMGGIRVKPQPYTPRTVTVEQRKFVVVWDGTSRSLLAEQFGSRLKNPGRRLVF